LRVAALDELGKLDLFLRRQQIVAADLVQEELHGVGRLRRQVLVVV
jgi:hypothetical protein